MSCFIGNDIVDFSAAGPLRHLNQGWLDKVFLANEQAIISAAAQPEQQLWALWAAKESAYKIFIKRERKRLFRPKAIQLRPSDKIGFDYLARYKDWQVGIQLKQEQHYVHCISMELQEPALNIQSEIFHHPALALKEGSHYTRQQLTKWLKRQGWEQPIILQKDELGIPYLVGQEKKIDLSFSHHGAYFAYALALNPQTIPAAAR